MYQKFFGNIFLDQIKELGLTTTRPVPGKMYFKFVSCLYYTLNYALFESVMSKMVLDDITGVIPEIIRHNIINALVTQDHKFVILNCNVE